MPRKNRAKQFAPFDALKGLHEALKLKEYEHDRSIKGDLPQEQIEAISRVILSLKKDDYVDVQYFYDGYNKTISGKARIDFFGQTLRIGNTIIPFTDILEIAPKTP